MNPFENPPVILSGIKTIFFKTFSLHFLRSLNTRSFSPANHLHFFAPFCSVFEIKRFRCCFFRADCFIARIKFSLENITDTSITLTSSEKSVLFLRTYLFILTQYITLILKRYYVYSVLYSSI